MTDVKHILVIRFSAMGDVAMTVPVIKALLEQHPELKITYVSRPEFAVFFSGTPGLCYYPVDFKDQYKGFAGLLKLFWGLKKLDNYDALADLHDNLRSKMIRKLFRVTGLKCAWIDKGREEKNLLTRFPNKIIRPLKQTTERYADVFRTLGYPLVLDHQLKRETVLVTTELEAIIGFKDKKWIGIAPFAKHKGKIFPLFKMEEVIRAFTNINVKIFLFGGSELEKEICEQWEKTYPGVLSLIKKINMEQELAVISKLDVMLSMDSSGMHLASLQGIPVVSIWGATHYYAGFLGYGQSPGNIVADNIECRPCSVYGDKPCFRKDYACLNRIEPGAIVNELGKFLT